MTKPLVIALGQATTDFFGALSRLPALEPGIWLQEVSVQVGGSAATAAAAAAALGCAARYCGKISDDFLGWHAIDALRGAGIDTEHVIVGTGRMSPFSFSAVGRDDGHKVGFLAAGDVGELRRDDLPIDALLEGASAVLVDGTSPDAQVALAEAARQRSLPVILDVGALREGLGELVAVADVLLSSERFASEIAPRGELQDSLMELQRLGPQAVIITLGDAGSIGLQGNQLVRQPVHPIAHVADTTGAGHVYHGAFASALVRGEPFARCMAFASVAAGLSCRRLGAMAGVPNLDDVTAALGE